MYLFTFNIMYKFLSFFSIIWLGQLSRVKNSDICEQYGPKKEDKVDTVCRRFGSEEHCYFLERYTFRENWNIQDLVSTCKDRVFEMISEEGCTQIPSVSGLAIESYDEQLFIEDFITSFHEPQLQAFTSGYWSCKLVREHADIKDLCGVWQGWNASINSFILQLQSCGFSDQYNCPLYNEILLLVLQKTSDEIYWRTLITSINERNYVNQLTSNRTAGPTYIACEYIMVKYENCSTTTAQCTTPADFDLAKISEVSKISMVTEYPGEVNTYPGTNETIGPWIEEDCALCQKKDGYGYEWIACSGEVRNQSCPYDAEGFALWKCGQDGLFVNEEPDYINCHHRWIADLESMVEQQKEADKIAERFLSDSLEKIFFGHEIAELADLLYNTSKLLQRQAAKCNPLQKAGVYEKFLPKLANITNNVIRRDLPWKQINMVLRAIAGSKLQTFLYCIGFTLIDAIYARDNENQIYLDYSFSNLRMGLQLTPSNQSTNRIVMSYPNNHTDKAGSITVYGEIKAGKGKSTLITSVGTIIDFKIGNQLHPEEMRSWRVPSKMVLNSAVISFKFQPLSHTLLGSSYRETRNEPLRIQSVIIELVHSIPARGPSEQLIRRDLFPGESPTAVISQAQCVFWDDLFQFGSWDVSGCKMTFTNETLTICNCSHLSSFGVFMSIHKYKNKGLTMELLSGICSGLSIICLILTLVVFQLFGANLQGERETICRNVCSCLLATHILSLSLLDKTYFNLSDTICSCVGAVLHYVLSAVFFWMAAEGHLLYILILRVMDGTGKDLRMTYYILSYGTPVLLIGLTAMVGFIQGEKAYGNPELCWLSLSNYQWSFISEALLISLVNSIVLTLSLKAASAVGVKSALKKLRIWVRGWFTLSSLLGITWFIGIATFNLNIYFEYVFVALNGLQGVWIFLSRVLQNEQLRNAVVKRWKKRTLLRRFYKNSITGNSSSNLMGASDKLRDKGTGKSQSWNVEEDSNSSSFQGNQALGDSLALRVLQDTNIIAEPKCHNNQSIGIIRGRFISP